MYTYIYIYIYRNKNLVEFIDSSSHRLTNHPKSKSRLNYTITK